jgi:dTDP-L-rhamnose 4-epimerase
MGSIVSKGLVLITGGAGFIGSHLVDELLDSGYRVRVLDALLPQVHPSGVPAYLAPNADLQHGDVRDPDTLRKALAGVDVVVHFAAAVGVGQSMYEITHYCSVNVMGTATLLEALVKEKRRPKRLLVASSMSIYGEGLYSCASCGPQSPGPRATAQLETHEWTMRCPRCSGAMEPRPTPETKPLIPTSVYAVNKRDQEEMVLTVGRSIGIPAIALRFFNVYGTRQSLSNPYTGVAAIFASALLNGRAPLVFEDGLQARDFVHVRDVARACRFAIEEDVADLALNVGTGRPTSLIELLALLQREIPSGRDVVPQVVGRFREGDIRSCYADVTLAREMLGFTAQVALDEGIKDLASWVVGQSSVDRSAEALDELRSFRLIR